MAEIWLRKYKGKTAASTVSAGLVMVYKIKVFDSINFKFGSPISPMPLPEESGQENILIKMEGNTHTFTITWLVKNESVNQGVTNGWSGSDHYIGETKTIFDVIQWFSDEQGFIGRNLDHSYEILVLDELTGLDLFDMSTSSAGTTSSQPTTDEWTHTDSSDAVFSSRIVRSMKGYIRDISFRTSKDEPATLRGTIEFIEGDNVAGYQGSTPAAVRSFKVETPSSGTTHDRMNISWTDPRHVGNSAIIGYDIGHRKLPAQAGDEFKWQFAEDPTSRAVTVSSLDADSDYQFRVAARNSDGRGTKSTPITRATAEAP